MVEIRNDEECINYIFKGSPWFMLDNFYMAKVHFEGLKYTNSEAAFQSAKTLDMELRQKFTSMGPSTAKMFGKDRRFMKLRPDWNEVKYDIMKTIVRDKMDRNKHCKLRLLETGKAEIIEGTYWNDRIWGIDLNTGIGENWLGKILMELRDEFNGE